MVVIARVFQLLDHFGNAQLAVIHSIEVAVLQGFTYNASLHMFNRDQGCWLLYRRWPLLRGDRCKGFHCIHMHNSDVLKHLLSFQFEKDVPKMHILSEHAQSCAPFHKHCYYIHFIPMRNTLLYTPKHVPSPKKWATVQRKGKI